jgi:hypothetical protein
VSVRVRVSQRESLAFLRYTGVTVVLWVVNLVIKFGPRVSSCSTARCATTTA